MKGIKIFSVLSLIFLLTQSVEAQPGITLEGFGGWLWTGKAGYNSNIKVDDKGNYGVRAGVSAIPQTVVEFEWNHTETTLHWYDLVQQENQITPVTANYYMLGFNKELMDAPVVPFGLLNLGVMNLKGQTISSGSFSENWFAVGLGGGLKYYFSDHVGIRLQARLLLPMQFAGLGVGCGTGGCGAGVSTYTTTIQGDFTGGIILKMGD